MSTSMLKDKTMSQEGKENIFKYLYGDPDVISKFKSTNPDTGQHIDQKDQAYFKLFNEANTKEAKKLGGEYLNNYVRAASRGFGNLFSADIAELNSAAMHPDFKITWDTDNHMFIARSSQNPSASLGLSQLPAAVNRINMAIVAYSSIAKETGQDVNAMLYQLFKDSGINVETDSVAGGMYRALNAGNKSIPD